MGQQKTGGTVVSVSIDKALELCGAINHCGDGFRWNSTLCRSVVEVLESSIEELSRAREAFPRKWWSKEEIGEREMRDLSRAERGMEIASRLRRAAENVASAARRLEEAMASEEERVPSTVSCAELDFGDTADARTEAP